MRCEACRARRRTRAHRPCGTVGAGRGIPAPAACSPTSRPSDRNRAPRLAAGLARRSPSPAVDGSVKSGTLLPIAPALRLRAMRQFFTGSRIASRFCESQYSMKSSRSCDDVQADRHVDHHLHGEHRGAGLRGDVAARGHFADFDAARLAKKPGKARDDAGLVRADHVDGVGDVVLAQAARLGAPQLHGEACRFGQPGEFGFDPGDARASCRRPASAWPNSRAQGQHAAFADAGAAVGDGADHVVHQAGAVFANGRDGQELLHAARTVMDSPKSSRACLGSHAARNIARPPADFRDFQERVQVMSPQAFAGSHVAIVTPFRDDGEIDWQAGRG